mgnify:CR=1 FL=1
MTQGISRRDFMRIGVTGAAVTVLAGCQQTRRYVELEPYVLPPEEQVAGAPTWYASTCRQCPAGCGIIVRIMNGRAVKIEGNPEHPLNRGGLCARGQAGLQVLYNPDRLQGPARQERQGSRIYESVYWEDAVPMLAERLREAGDAVGVWGGATMSGHLYDLLTRFTDAVGAPSPVIFDLYSAVNGYHALQSASEALFDADGLPAYSLAQADVVFGFNADFLGTGPSAVRYGAEYGAFRGQALGKRGFLAQFEPRMSITGAVADQWAPVQPGHEALVAGAIARLIADGGFGPAERVERARALAAVVDIERAAAACEMTVERLARLAEAFATAGRAVALPGGPLAGLDNAVEAITAVQALNVISGAAGAAGGMALTPPLEGLADPQPSSYAEAQALIARMAAGDVKVLMVFGANPVYDLPAASGFVEAVQQVPFVVTFTPLIDETATYAHLVMPVRTYLESWGYEVVSPGFELPIVGSQQPVVAPRYDARAAADVLLEAAKSVPGGAEALPWQDEVAFLKETLNQLPAGAHGGDNPDVKWARTLQHGGWWPAQAAPQVPQAKAVTINAAPAQFQGDEAEYPYYLHLYTPVLLSDGSGASQPWLQGCPDPMTTISWQSWVELNPKTAEALGVKPGDVVRVASPHGEIEAPVFVYPALRPDTVAVPLGQGHAEYGRYAEKRGANAMQLVGAQTDASGAHLAFATVRVRVTPTGEHTPLALAGHIEGSEEGIHF